MNKIIKIIGAGLAGSEAALQMADKGWKVKLYEMRPLINTPAHQTDLCAELVCSNSLKSKLPSTSSGVLKAEMDLLGCKLLNIARESAVEAGNALAVDREVFAQKVSKIIKAHPNIEYINQEITELNDELTILATGPLTSLSLTEQLLKCIGEEQLYFFDAIAPVVTTDSIDYSIAFSKSRYDDSNSDYINCPFNKEEYYNFVEALNLAEKHEAREFENEYFKDPQYKFYENCMPIEELARRGKDTLRFGVMRPVGLEDPRTGRRPYALVQLRIENKEMSAYNLVGCQTMLKYSEQTRIFRMIPGLQHAEFTRLGSIHRNTYVNTPSICNPDLSLKNKSNVYLAGQLSGVEGYMESIFSGLLVSKIISENLALLPETTISGQLWRYLITENKHFLPMNSNFGILPPLDKRYNKKDRKAEYGERAIADMRLYLENI